jgi:hypothetical protein
LDKKSGQDYFGVSVWIQNENNKINQRNERRRQWKRIVSDAYQSIKDKKTNNRSSSSRLTQKLLSAKSMQQSIKRMSDTKIIYDTKQTTIETLNQQKQQSEFDEFDNKLK